MKYLAILLLLTLTVNSSLKSAQKEEAKKQKDNFTSQTFNGLKFRSIGPALTSGRISDFAVNPKDRSQYYAAAASGGVWKTTNAGTSWTPVFDNEGSYSIGCLAMDPKDPNVIWVGTGENNSQRSVSYGDGIYRSDDGGKSWKNLGLKTSEHIAKILIDPRNSNTVYAASQGPLWGPGGERGLYKSTDNGQSWKAVLTISENTGINDITFDPQNPDVIYASSYQRRRHVYTVIDGGPESAIYKSTDAGATWNKLTSGLPTSDMGKIGLAVSPVNPEIVYAVIEASQGKGGFFRSTDKGATWEKRSGYVSGSAQYYNEIYADPKDQDRVYAMDTYLMVTDDGGKTFRGLGERFKHVDNHAMWIDPSNTNYYLVGCDGGVYESFDRGQMWNFKSNLPVTQFYRVALDNALPFYYVYGGTQDNFSLGGPSATTNISGIPNSDWYITQGGDGFYSRVDPEDPSTVYAESQYGGLVRYDKKTGEIMGIKPVEAKDEEPLRWNWDAPLIISPHSHTRLYFAANKLFRSDDRGNSWKEISGDLTRQLDRNKLPVMGKVWGADAVAKNASTSFFGNIVSLSESPVKEGVIYAGTDDGLINVTDNGGESWKKIEKFPGVPEMTYVSCILTSQHDQNTVYAAFDNHKNADFKPYILKSVDGGKSWKSIQGNLPERGTVYTIAEDHVNPKLLFAGTEFGVFFTVDGGEKWIQLKGGLPTIAVKDMAIQKRENDLVLATFGRGFYILDNYTPLRDLKPETLAKETEIFPVKDAYMYVQSRPIGNKGKGFLGESYYLGENPPFGATFTIYLKDAIKSKKQIRQESEKEAVKDGGELKYPSNDELRSEEREEMPYLLLTITDESGSVVNKLRAPAASGIQRLTWDFRYPATTPIKKIESEEEDDPFYEADMGALALPGKYNVTLSKVVDGTSTLLAGPVEFKTEALSSSTLSKEDRLALSEFQHRLGELRRAVRGTIESANEVSNQLRLIRQALKNSTRANGEMATEVNRLENELYNITLKLSGDRILQRRNENTAPSLSDRIEGIVYDQWQSSQAPTQTQRDQMKIVSEEFAPLLAKFKILVEGDLKKLETSLEVTETPWSPGRLPSWQNN
ncbi:MAG TPA: glycosyl hydrolase [Ignavibacteriales bacterium]|nr:glycosyl hydrolase [Ignavibacteriales bacterium]